MNMVRVKKITDDSEDTDGKWFRKLSKLQTNIKQTQQT